MHRQILSIGFVLALLLAISGCGADPEVQLAEISRNTVVYDEIVRLNNCGGKGDSDHTATREFATTIEFGAGISAGYKAVVEGNISAKYSEYRNTSKSIRVVAPPGTNMEFVLRWSDDVRAGNVQVNEKSGTYEVRIPVSVEQISSRDLGCGIPSQQSPPSNLSVSTPSTQSMQIGKCPTTSTEAANLFGGSPSYWRRLEGHEQYAWKYGPAPASPISNLNIPEGMKGDWWDNYQVHSQVGPAKVGYASEVTIWCVP
jgi:hypothetical protein